MTPLTLEEYAKADLYDVLNRLTTQEKISLLAGPDWWTTVPIDRVGVPRIKVSDGPNGVRGSSHFLPTPAQCLPCATALGATFDTDAIHAIGGVLAREAKAKGSSLILGPTTNIQRHPLNGRAFESFSEDPLLSGHIAAAYINGMQEAGVGATIKHFVGNDMEDERMSVDVQIPERALREIYLKPFELAQKLSKPWSFMTSYSRLNGVHASESSNLLQKILRDEWKFDGLVMSDWYGTYSTVEAVEAGLDLEMPGPTRWRGSTLAHAIVAGKVSLETIDARAFAVLQVIQRACRADIDNVRHNREKERTHESVEDRATCRQVTAESVVLLKNDKLVLPLAKEKLKRVAVIGPNAHLRTVSGGGSAYLTSSYVVTPLDGIKAALAGTGAEVAYAPGCYSYRYLPMLDGWIKTKEGASGWTARFYNAPFDSGVAPIATADLLGTRIRINDEKPEGLADRFYLSVEGYVTADQTGEYEFGISVVGRAQVYVDDRLVIDNGWDNQQTRGTSFYGLGSIEELGTTPFVAGQTYKVVVKYTNVPATMTGESHARGGQPALMMAALRLGGAYKLEEDEGIEKAAALAESADAVVVVIGTNMDWEAEGADRESLALPGRTDELVSRVLAANPNAIVVNQSGSAVAMPWAAQASAIVQAWFAGNECGNALADVLFGTVNPSGRMPMSFPHRIEDCTAHLNWGSESGRVLYGEGVFVGYRGYQEMKRDVLFGFGEGLSFTTFEWSSMKVSGSKTVKGDDLSVTIVLTVKNVGAVAGRDVVQLYVSPAQASSASVKLYRRPQLELKAFVKTRLLAPGESQEVSLTLDRTAFAYWRDSKVAAGWMVDAGRYGLVAAKSSVDDQALRDTIVVEQPIGPWRGI